MSGRLREAFVRLKQLVTPGSSLESRTVTSGFWLGSTKVADRGLQILMLVFLANLLDPRDFGLMGIAMLSFSALTRFSNLGINSALVQNEDEDVDDYLDTAWLLELARYAVIATVLFLGAPLVAQLFDEPGATALLRVFALVPVFRGLKNPAIVYFQKDLEYQLQFVYRVSGSVTQLAVAVAWALVSPTVWALIAALVTAEVTRTFTSYVVHPYRPWPSFEMAHAKEIIDYGKWLTGSSILNFLGTEGDDVVVGALAGATALGFYQLAYRLSNAPATEFSEVIAGVMFPAFSKLQNDPERLRAAFLRVLQVTAFVSIPASFGIALVAPSFVRAFLGPDWVPMILTMQILAAYGLLRAIGRTFSPAWKAIGRPDYVTKLSLVRIAILAVLIVPATSRFGIEGTAALVVGVYVFPMMPLDLWVHVRSIEITYWEFVQEVVYPFAASVVMAGCILLVQDALAVSPVVEFVTSVAVGVVTYAVAAGVMMTTFDWGIETNLLSAVESVRG
jgi:O-antigen/teichoic acid export membrane protein